MRTTPTPDIERMVNGGQDRLRRRNRMRIGGLAAAAVLVVGVGVYGATQIGGDDPDAGVADAPSERAETGAPQSWVDSDGAPVDPGTYRAYVGADADGADIVADLTVDGSNWAASNYPVAFDGEHFAGIGVYQPRSVAGGCQMEAGLKPAVLEPQQLARQLAQMPRSHIVQQPTPTTAFGHAAIHLRLQIDAACVGDAAYQVADAPAGSRGISYFETPEASRIVNVEFWVVDLDGTTIVVDMFHSEDAPRTLVETAAAARDSITFVEGG